ncbi:hypothetical protein [Hyphomonas pacifica]|uniref:Carboxymuconolactone decarboxylase-like domain-containing protein n=1 Tax=Hyphomonas pacifica TaxID=1280941 RepID=A0A062U4N9_9PROT|nr:hypothetical protein [Hyphomonas pacifica]KCZ52698.1 hypothetical protein HY2_08120 [Hyphomonas pacifica]RAN34062.1 hypothetical protein HY3_11585 [Hyphomonas pacifica]
MTPQTLRAQARTMGQQFNYDTTYMEEIIDISPTAAEGLMSFVGIYKYRGPAAGKAAWHGALFASTLEGDCGPCVQLVLDMAIADGADADALKACAEGEAQSAGTTGLGFRFAMAAITADLATDDLRRQIEAEFGNKTALSCAFAAAAGRFYPVLKRGTGHGQPCRVLDIAGQRITVAA